MDETETRDYPSAGPKRRFLGAAFSRPGVATVCAGSQWHSVHRDIVNNRLGSVIQSRDGFRGTENLGGTPHPWSSGK
jgi:hypothetical protein